MFSDFQANCAGGYETNGFEIGGLNCISFKTLSFISLPSLLLSVPHVKITTSRQWFAQVVQTLNSPFSLISFPKRLFDDCYAGFTESKLSIVKFPESLKGIKLVWKSKQPACFIQFHSVRCPGIYDVRAVDIFFQSVAQISGDGHAPSRCSRHWKENRDNSKQIPLSIFFQDKIKISETIPILPRAVRHTGCTLFSMFSLSRLGIFPKCLPHSWSNFKPPDVSMIGLFQLFCAIKISRKDKSVLDRSNLQDCGIVFEYKNRGKRCLEILEATRKPTCQFLRESLPAAFPA